MSNKLTKQQAEAKIFELTDQLLRVKQDKKDMAAGYREKIKAIESEIEAIIEESNDTSSE